MNLQIFICILFILLALPLATIAWTARQAALELNVLPTEETQTRGESPLVREPDGSLTQTFTMQLLVSERVTVKRVMGPATLWPGNTVRKRTNLGCQCCVAWTDRDTRWHVGTLSFSKCPPISFKAPRGFDGRARLITT